MCVCVCVWCLHMSTQKQKWTPFKTSVHCQWRSCFLKKSSQWKDDYHVLHHEGLCRMAAEVSIGSQREEGGWSN